MMQRDRCHDRKANILKLKQSANIFLTTLLTLTTILTMPATEVLAHSDEDRGSFDRVVANQTIPSNPKQRCPKFEAVFKEYGLLPVDVFSYIAWRESRCRIKAINIIYDKHGKVVWALNRNGTFDSGLLQVNSGHKEAVRKVCRGGLELLMTLDCNLKFAKYLLENGGLNHWRISSP